MLMMLGDPGADSTSKKQKDQNETSPGNERTLQIRRLQKEVAALKIKLDISRKMYDVEQAVTDLNVDISREMQVIEKAVTDLNVDISREMQVIEKAVTDLRDMMKRYVTDNI